MKKLLCITNFLVIFISIHAYSGPGNFKKGDTWKYSYWRIGWDKYEAMAFADTESGVISFCLDSITTKPDSTVWHITKRDSLRIKQTSTNHAWRPDTLYSIDTISHQRPSIVNGVMLGNLKDFFSFYPIKDSTDSQSVTKRYFQNTNIANATIDGNISPIFNRIRYTMSCGSGSGGFWEQSDNDTLQWCDSLGLYQKKRVHTNITAALRETVLKPIVFFSLKEGVFPLMKYPLPPKQKQLKLPRDYSA